LTFGRARPATGFSLDLRGVVTALPAIEATAAIFAPADAEPTLAVKIASLRAEGHVVVQAFPEEEVDLEELNCDRELSHFNSGWHVVAIKKN